MIDCSKPPIESATMNSFETIQDLIDHLTALPKDVKQSPVLTPRDVSGSYSSLSDTSFMYIDRDFEAGDSDEVWDYEDLVGPGESEEEAKEIMSRFKKVLVLWFE